MPDRLPFQKISFMQNVLLFLARPARLAAFSFTTKRSISTFSHLHRRFYDHHARLERANRFLAASSKKQMDNNSNNSYDGWSRDELIARLRALETSSTPGLAPASSDSTSTTPKAKDGKKRHKKKSQQQPARPFVYSAHPTRKIALRLAYFGWPYHGFAAQAHSNETIEHHLFAALRTTRLVDPDTPEGTAPPDYSRCGRTDKGVSAAGNAVALVVRSRIPADDPRRLSVYGSETPHDDQGELPYLAMLNRALPDHIRVVAWSPVADDFSARFSCGARSYKYFLPAVGLDIARMREAAAAFIGTHDFRHFCKIDPTKPVRNYERTMLEVTIVPAVDGVDVDDRAAELPLSVTGSSNGLPHQYYVLTVRGTAFLWHQIRCMMHVLLLVGQGLEPPTVVRDMLAAGRAAANGDESSASRPQYDLAPELPLVLWDCDFPNLFWRYADNPRDPLHSASGLAKHLATMHETLRTQALAVDLLLRHVWHADVPWTAPARAAALATLAPNTPARIAAEAQLPPPTTTDVSTLTSLAHLFPLIGRDALPWGVNGSLVPLLSTARRAPRAHIPLARRQTCDSVAEKQVKLEARLKRKRAEEEGEGEEEAMVDETVVDDDTETRTSLAKRARVAVHE
ncbi:pseudouridine synthase [Blastocladiella britannica]|nr:pseudouridine synthase [Blastocladiella britannica]